MEIQSALNAGIQGFQRAENTANEAAVDIAAQVAEGRKGQEELQESSNTTLSASGDEPTNLNQSLVELKVAEVQASASANVIKTADENLGTLIDVRV